MSVETSSSLMEVAEEKILTADAQDIFVAPTIAISGNADALYEFHYFVVQAGATGGASYFLATANGTQFAGNSQQWIANGTSVTSARDTTMIVGTNSQGGVTAGNTGIGWFPKISTNASTVRHCIHYGNRGNSTGILLQSRVHSVTTPSVSTNLVAFGLDTNKTACCGSKSILRLLRRGK